MTTVTTWPCAALHHADLSTRTTMRVGGAAEWLLEPTTPEELAKAITAAREEGFVPRILGGGANLIVDDGVLPGVVITTARMQRLFRVDPRSGEELAEGLTDAQTSRVGAIRATSTCASSLGPASRCRRSCRRPRGSGGRASRASSASRATSAAASR